ncbi:MAG TPA: hypothetical protein VLF18_17040 [Tahibacter sp.]|uniref:hypothetical protein n=1 Tax=Tahibacter sp. TaxID=2056211 RepID=UPI002CA6D834|nr:hypothetical protein [Tahibacter sp.]HSX61897.1 hypothetical protein [Tahibacter sp.]
MPPWPGMNVDDQRDYARYGQTLGYAVPSSDTGTIAAMATLATTSPGAGLNLANAQWVCATPGIGTGCIDGSGPLNASVSIPGGQTMTWTFPANVFPTAAGTTVELRVAGTSSANVAEDNDADTLVVFRNGIELP